MHIDSARRAAGAVAALGILLGSLTACGGTEPGPPPAAGAGPAAGEAVGRDLAGRDASRRGPVPEAGGPAGPAEAGTVTIPGVGGLLQRRIPATTGQVLVVYGEGRDSAESTVVFYTRHRDGWRPAGAWAAHNGRQGWTTDHHAGDERSPVGVFSLTDAGGALPDPGTRLPYTHDTGAYAPPYAWDPAHLHDFDYVVAIDYNRVRGAPPHDRVRPWGGELGGGIWLHVDHGDGTAACVSVAEEVMEHLLRTLDPARHPVVIMGNREELLV
ncbi:L,D-transpeptidase family protein [Streptomyces sp. J2-1]|uniref:L,D-transpeptidase family protein n=1 Tax=Streptomyces corallincola TaxID=2851888 RepID=UPI001C39045E|nr:L,D-transpeptidase family protein [Streptomyces corallincola]MBV2352833.1 L,D-transpeptidase family protein [Streptomyces corallincola]